MAGSSDTLSRPSRRLFSNDGASRNATLNAATNVSSEYLRESRHPVLQLGLVLMQTFLAILVGYAAISLGLLKPEDIGVVGFITGRVALPLLIFHAVATLEVRSINIRVLFALVIAKLVVQLATMLIFVLRNLAQTGRGLLEAGIYGLYTSSSADFPMGFPVIGAVFPRQTSQHNYIAYLTMLAVAQDLIGNVIGILALEAGKARQAVAEEDNAQRPPLYRAIAWNILHNPLLRMTCAGLLYKLFFGWSLVRSADGLELPMGLSEAVDMLTSPFRFCVLFQVGLSVGSLTFESVFAKPSRLIKIVSLNLVKLLVLPLLMVMLVINLWSDSSVQGKHERNGFLHFTLIFGGLPAPASMVVFARLYGVNTETLAPSVPVGFALSGPLIWTHTIIIGMSHNWSTTSVEEHKTLECALQIPGLICAACLTFLIMAGGRNWCSFMMGAFFQFALAILLWHVAKLMLIRLGCDAAYHLVHFLYAFSSQQVRLCGVILACIVLMQSYGFGRLPLVGFFISTMYFLPLMLAAPSLFPTPHQQDHPFWIMSCLYVGNDWQRIVDRVVCVVGLAVNVAVLGAYAVEKRRRKQIQVHNSGYSFASGGSPDNERSSILSLGAPEGSKDDTGQEGEQAQSSWTFALMSRLAEVMSYYAVLLLLFDGSLAIAQPHRGDAWRASVTAITAGLHAFQGALLFLLFCLCDPAHELYYRFGSWLVSCSGEVLPWFERISMVYSDSDDFEWESVSSGAVGGSVSSRSDQ